METSKRDLQEMSIVNRAECRVCYREIPVADISIGDRVRQDPTRNIDHLVSSIRTCGLLHPITVREQDSFGKYLLLAGERRLEACKRLGKESIPAMVHFASDCAGINERSPQE